MNKTCRRIIAVFGVIVILLAVLSGCTVQQEQETQQHSTLRFSGSSGYVKVAESGDLRLFVDPATAQFYCENAQTGYILRSNPEDPAADAVASNLFKMNMQAQMTIGFVNDHLSYEDINNYVGAVRDKTFTYKPITNGARFDFDFSYEGFVVPMEITLTDGRLQVSVPVKDIVEYKTNKITECALLPYMGSALGSVGGNIVLADGCGALLPINTDKATAAAGKYVGYVYGRDDAYSQSAKPLAEETELTLPMFGVQSPAGGFLAQIEEGEALCKVTATPAHLETERASVYATAVLRNADTAVLQEMSGSARTVQVLNPYMADIERMTVSWQLLDKDDSYVDMASILREQLPKTEKKEQTDLFLELLLSVRENGTFLAIPMEVVTELITFDRAGEIADDLTEQGVDNLLVRMDGWQRGSGYHKVPSLNKVQGSLGGLSDFKKLLSRDDVTFLPSVDYLNLYSSGNGISKKGDAVRDVSGGFYEQSEYMRSTYTKSQRVDAWHIAKSNVFADLLTKAAGKALTLGTGLFDLTGGNILPSDGHRSASRGIVPTDREMAKNAYVAAYAAAAQQGKGVWLDDPSGYALTYASGATRLANTASGYAGFSEEIPLVQMVYHGRISYSGTPMNTASDYHASLLRAAEFGEAPLFSLTEMKEASLPSRYNDNFSASLEWLDAAVEAYKFLTPAREASAGQTMTDHRCLAEGVYQTTYGNGSSVIVNYTDAPWAMGDNTVAAHSYIVI